MKRVKFILFLSIFFLQFNLFGKNSNVVEKEEYDETVKMIIDKYINDSNKIIEHPVFKDNTEQLDELITNIISKEITDLEKREDVISTTNMYSNIIFFVIHIMLLIGITAAIIEFVQSYRIRRNNNKIEPDTSVTIKMEELAIKSSSIGIFLLVISSLFYFMYLKFVYPVIAI